GRSLMRIRGLLALTLVVAFAGPARAVRSCGDDVDGHGKRVACACGDVLVSARVLGPADEVTAAPCPANGLVVAASGPVTLDLGGRTIAGDGQGIGILVVRGSLLLVGPGAVERFQVGVLARGVQALRSAVNVRVAGNRLDGLVAQGDGFTVVGSVAEGNGRNGFSLGGTDYALDGNRASENGRHGFKLTGMGAHVGGGFGNEAIANAGARCWLLGVMPVYGRPSRMMMDMAPLIQCRIGMMGECR